MERYRGGDIEAVRVLSFFCKSDPNSMSNKQRIWLSIHPKLEGVSICLWDARSVRCFSGLVTRYRVNGVMSRHLFHSLQEKA